MSGFVLVIIAAFVLLPVVLLLRWSLGKSAKLKQQQIEFWTPLAEKLDGHIRQHEGRWNHHVLHAVVHGVPVRATISHNVAADANIASRLTTNNEFRTQVHAPVAVDGRVFIVTGTKDGKGKMSFGDGVFRQRFRASKDEGFESVASAEAQTLMLALWPHFRAGAQLVSGGSIVSMLFASNTTDPVAIENAVKLVGAIAGAGSEAP